MADTVVVLQDSSRWKVRRKASGNRLEIESEQPALPTGFNRINAALGMPAKPESRLINASQVASWEHPTPGVNPFKTGTPRLVDHHGNTIENVAAGQQIRAFIAGAGLHGVGRWASFRRGTEGAESPLVLTPTEPGTLPPVCMGLGGTPYGYFSVLRANFGADAAAPSLTQGTTPITLEPITVHGPGLPDVEVTVSGRTVTASLATPLTFHGSAVGAQVELRTKALTRGGVQPVPKFAAWDTPTDFLPGDYALQVIAVCPISMPNSGIPFARSYSAWEEFSVS